MTTTQFRWGAGVASALLVCLSCSILAAQDPPDEDDPEPPATVRLTDDETDLQLPPAPPLDDDEPIATLPSTTVVGELTGEAAEVTTPTRTETNIGQVGSSTTVITSEQIQDSGYSMVGDVLRGTAGLDIVQQGSRGSVSSVFLRGANSHHTKVLMDGIPINDPSHPSRAFDFSNLSVDEVERIEVVRGPQSTLYGTDAIGGVINIITKRGEGPPMAEVRFMGGAYGTNRDSARVSGGTDKYHYSLGGSYFYMDGYSAASERLGNTEDDASRIGSASGRFGWTPTDDFDIDYVFRWTDVRAEIDDVVFDPVTFRAIPTDDPLRLNLTESFFTRVAARWDALDGGVEQKVSFSFTDYTRRDTDDLFGSRFLGQTRMFDYQANLLVTCNNVLTAGIDYLDEHASSDSGTDASQYKHGIYLQDQFQIGPRWFNTVGVRWDDWNTAGAAETYQFRSVYKVDETGTSFHGSLGTGFRAPSLSDLFDPFVGNPDLVPEHSRGWDAGVGQRLLNDRLTVDVTYFRNDFRDLIQFLFDPTSPTFGSLQNVGQARTHGVEVLGRLDVSQSMAVSASYTRTDSVDAETGLPLLRRPRDKGSVGVTYLFSEDRAAVDLYAMFFGKRLDSPGSPIELDGYTLLNLAAHYQVTHRSRVFCRFDNLLNQHYEEVLGYATPAFSAYGGCDLQW